MAKNKHTDLTDGFLKIVFDSQMGKDSRMDNIIEAYNPLNEKLKELLTEKVYDEKIEEIFWECFNNAIHYCAVESMKMAIGIMDGSYVPYI